MTGDRRVLQDPTLDERLRTEGYAQFPFLDPDEVRQLREAYDALRPAADDGLVIDFTRSDRDVMRATTDLLLPTWERHLPEVFVDHEVVVTTFVVKYPGPGSDMGLHDEPSFVDERDDRTFVVWVPLVDVAPDLPNGALGIIPGSHRLPGGLAGYNTPIGYRRYGEVLAQRLQLVTAAAGSALVYDSRTLHASLANLSSEPRPAITCSIARRDAPLVHVVATGRRHRRVHRVDRDFFVEHHPLEVAAHGVPDRYPVIEELDEDVELRPIDVAHALGLDEPPTPRTLVPADLRELGGARAAVELEPVERRPQAAATDLVLRRADLPEEVDADVHVAAATAAGIAPLTPERMAALGAHAAPLQRRVPRDLAVLDPQGRMALAPPDGRRGSVVVLECPAVNAGARTVRGAVTAEPGLVLDLAEPLWLWNEGPGPLVVAVELDPAPGPRWRRVAGAVRDRLRGGRPA